MLIVRLFFEFFKVGLFAVGGGAATIPFLYDISDRTHWFTHTDLANMVAISQSVPGAMGINMATYVGYATDGIIGGIVATIGIVVPSIIIILLVARVLSKFKENKIVADCFYGLRPASTGLLFAAGFEIVKISILTLDKYDKTHNIFDIVSFKALILAIILYFLINKFKKSPIFYIALSAIIGIIFNFAQ
ncbi:chromate transporter [Clostridium sp. LIBA-8841]|uniref:chromate transporter n=1 Tax=Clostridium sp. LIBA-8841 TaxID=2987530 RepID=UPI002AC71B98|nr:chromate transporter [Clostridium sp. LIBA-8841]MDZ5255391.1 chromate transporter [Clostridium sp. LIBA-8841]